MSVTLPRYLEHAPAPALRGAVECYWTTCGILPSGAIRRHRVLPDGCMDIILDLENGTAEVIGTMTRALEVGETGRVDLLGVRFRPGCAPAALGIPADRCVDGRIELSEAWRGDAAALLERVAEAASGRARRELLDRDIAARLHSDPPDRLVRAAARQLGRTDPPTVARLAAALGAGRRTLERRFQAGVGISPWHLARIERFRRAATLVLETPDDLSRAAHAAGYHDQPHMNRAFRELAGVSPGAWLRERRNADASVQDPGRSGR